MKRIGSGIKTRFLSIYRGILFIEKHSVFVQILILLILLCTLRSYLKSNQLATEANVLNRKAAIISHTPWLRVDPNLVFSTYPDEKTLGIALNTTNPSDTPILNVRSYLSLGPAGEPPTYDAKQLKTLPPIESILPQGTRPLSFWIDKSDSPISGVKTFNAKQCMDALINGSITVRIYISYDTIFSQSINEEVDLIGDPQKFTFKVLKETITGFDTY